MSAPIVPADQLTFVLDRSTPLPLYAQVAAQLEEAILGGILAPGARLENEVAIAQRLGLSRPTARRAIQELVDAGLVVRRRGIGTQVVHGPITRRVELTSLYDDLARAHQDPTTRVIESGRAAASDDEADALGVARGSMIVRIRRLRAADGIPIAILHNALPIDYADVVDSDLMSQGLYQVLRARGVGMRVAKQRIGARGASGAEARLLEITRHDPILTMSRTAYDADGHAVEFGTHCYRPDRYSFSMTLVDR